MFGIKSKIKKLIGIKSEVQKSELDILVEKGLTVGKTSLETIYSVEGIDHLFPWLITIGENVIISADVRILAHDASSANFCGYSKIGCVNIGNKVFIGTKTTILCGVTIGDNIIVGANSLVVNDLEGGWVYGGVPAKKIERISDDISKKEDDKSNTTYFFQNFLYW